MAQSILNHNVDFYADKRVPATSRPVTVASGQGVLAKNTALMFDIATSKYIVADENATPANTNHLGWCVLLEDIDATSADVATKAGTTGGIDEDTLVFAGTELTAISESARVIFAMNNIFVNKRSDSITNV